MSMSGQELDPRADWLPTDLTESPLAQLSPPGRRARRPWQYGLFRALLLVAILVVPGMLEPIARVAPFAHPRGVSAAAGTLNRLPTPRARHQAAPPTPSGANPPYPLNHTFDAALVPLGGPANADFETPGYTVGTPPTNAGFDTAPAEVGTQPANNHFATGVLTPWTASGSGVSIQTTGGPEEQWVKLDGSSAAITSAAFTVDATAQVVLFDLGSFTPSGTATVYVYARSGATYGTETLVRSFSCASCTSFVPQAATLAAFVGQSIKLKFLRIQGTIGIDRVRQAVVAEGFVNTETIQWLTDGSNPYLKLADGTLTSSAFTIDSEGQLLTLRLAGLGSGSNQASVDVLTGASYGTATNVLAVSPGAWATYRVQLDPWTGQSIKLRVRKSLGWIGIDDVGIQRVELPSWTISGTPQRVADGGAGHAAYGGTLTSSALTLDAQVQQVSVRYKVASNGAGFYFELLRGPGFATVVDLGTGPLAGTIGAWTTFKRAINIYAGQTVKFRIRPQLGAVTVDDVGLQEQIVPGWSFGAGSGAAVVAEDANGTYVTGWTSGGSLQLDSSPLSLGIVDSPASVDARSYVVSYAIGEQTGSVLYVSWVPEGGPSVLVYTDAADHPTGFRNGRFALFDTMGQSGQFRVTVTGGKLYSLGDNVARQQLAEPFAQQVRGAGGSAIDPATGSVGVSATDLAIQGGPLPLGLTRTYAGHSDRHGEFGYRWSHSYDAYAAAYTGGDVAIVFGSGKEEFFDWNAAYGYFAPIDPRVTSTLRNVTINGDLLYQYVTKEGLTSSFATTAAGDLLSISDRNGNQLTVYRDPATGLISSVADDAGRALSFTYNGGGQLIQVTDPAGGTVSYSYDGAGDLVAVEQLITAGATPARTAYTYSRHRLLTIAQRQGDDTTNAMVPILTNELDEVNRVIGQTDADGHTIEIAYQSPANGVTEVTDALDHTTRYYFDDHARTTHVELPDGTVSQFVFDTTGQLQKVIDGSNGTYEFAYNTDLDPDHITDPLNQLTTVDWDTVKHLPTETIVDPGDRGQGFLNLHTVYTYDSAGNLTRVVVDPTDPAQPGTELNLVSTWSYNPQGMVTQETIDPGLPPHVNLVTTYTYDASGYLKLSETVDPGASPHLNLTTSYTYDFAGRLETETDPNQHTTTYSYDLAGRLIERQNHLGESIYFGHDFDGHVTAIHDALGHHGYFTYDSRGLMTSKTDGEGNIWTYLYDDDGNLETVTDPLDDVTTYVYDENGQIAAIIDPLNHTTTYTYTVTGQVASVTDPLGRETVYEYDEGDRLVRQFNPDLVTLWQFAYDAAGRLLKTTDPTGHWSTSQYDAANRLVQTIVDADNPNLAGNERNQVTTYTYDAAGRETGTTVDPGSSPHLDLITESHYDAASRVTKTIDPLGNFQEYTYFPGGQLGSVRDENGQFTYYEYDAANRQTEITNPNQLVTQFGYDDAGRRTSITSGGITTVFTYDNRDLLLSQVVDPNPTGQSSHLALTTTYGYDELGRRITETNPRHEATTYGFDAAGRRTSITDANGEVVNLTYDAAGQLDTVTNARGYITDYDWDLNGNPDSTTDALLNSEEYDYNALGQLTASTDRRGVTSSYAYDGAGNLTSVSYPAVGGAPAGAIAYTFDQANRQTSMTDAVGTTIWAYDAGGNVLQVDGPLSGDAIDYSYDDAGRKATMTLPGSKTITYGRDAGGRVTSVEDWQSQTTSMTYTAIGSLDTIQRPNGVDSKFDYDAAGRLNVLEHTGGGTLLARYAYALDANGNRTQVAITGTAVSAHVEDYTYDELDRLLSASYGPSDSVAWTYDENGNRLTQTSGGQTTTYVYNEVDWLTDTTGAFISSSQYDAAGNRTGVCYSANCSTPTDLFGYDWKGHTASATVGGQSVSYAYTGDDIRASRTAGTTTTNYLWDRGGLVPTLVGDGATDRVFLEGQVLEEVSGSADTYPLTDALRSVRLTTDASGTASGAVDYDVWGNIRAGTSSQLGWTGELADPTTGQMYFRARDYSPGTGRFTSRDTLLPNASGTNGYNPYWYANDNPATLSDPTGHLGGALTLPRYCVICTPILDGALEPFVATAAALAASAREALRNYATALLWAFAAFLLVAAIFICILSPSCHEHTGVVTGKAIDAVEETKEQVDALASATVAIAAMSAAEVMHLIEPEPASTPGRRLPIPTDPADKDRNFDFIYRSARYGNIGDFTPRTKTRPGPDGRPVTRTEPDLSFYETLERPAFIWKVGAHWVQVNATGLQTIGGIVIHNGGMAYADPWTGLIKIHAEGHVSVIAEPADVMKCVTAYGKIRAYGPQTEKSLPGC